MSNELLLGLIGSSVIAAVISGVFRYVENKKNSKLDMITKERSEWRKEIKLISEGLVLATNEDEVKLNLTKLKVRINPFGYRGKKQKKDKEYTADEFDKDVYLWDAIWNIESNRNNKKFIDILVFRLTLLLKFDWERSKNEVIGASLKTRYILLFFSYYLIVFGYALAGYLWRDINVAININDLTFALFISFFTPLIPIALAENNFYSLKNTKLPEKIFLGIINFVLGISGIIMFIGPTFIIISLIMRTFFQSNNLSSLIILLSTILIYVFLFLILFIVWLLALSKKTNLNRMKYLKMLNNKSK